MAREREWAKALARQLASELPDAVRAVPDVRLTPQQVEQLRSAFEKRLIETMGQDADEAPAKKAN